MEGYNREVGNPKVEALLVILPISANHMVLQEQNTEATQDRQDGTNRLDPRRNAGMSIHDIHKAHFPALPVPRPFLEKLVEEFPIRLKQPSKHLVSVEHIGIGLCGQHDRRVVGRILTERERDEANPMNGA